MLKTYLVTAWRGIRRNVMHSVISIAGLATGIGAAALLLLFLASELSYDRFHTKAEWIHRVSAERRHDEVTVASATTTHRLAARLLEQRPEVECAARLVTKGTQVVRAGDEQLTEEGLLYTEPSFLEVFDFPLERGKAASLGEPGKILLTRTAARRYFGDRDPMGESLLTSPLDVSATRAFTVAGVLADVPVNSHVRFEMLASMSTLGLEHLPSFVHEQACTYVLLREGDTDSSELASFLLEGAGGGFSGTAKYSFHLQPLTEIHLHSHLRNEIGTNCDVSFLHLSAMAAAVVLLVACGNYVNLATARGARRLMEVGVRKCLGATRLGVAGQILAEALLLSWLALTIGLAVVEFALPHVDGALASQLAAVTNRSSVVAAAVVLATLVGLLSGAYPAVVLSRLQPSAVLRGGNAPIGHARLRRGLMALQFALSIGLAAGTLVMVEQMEYTRSRDLGLDADNVITMPPVVSRDVLRELETHHGVLATTAYFDMTSPHRFHVEGRSAEEPFRMGMLQVDESFLTTLGIELLAGRNLDAADAGTPFTAYLINETAARELGWHDPVGRTLNQRLMPQFVRDDGRVVGVVRDFHLGSLHAAVAPLALTAGTNLTSRAAVRISPEHRKEALSFVSAKLKELAPDEVVELLSWRAELASAYRMDTQISRVVRWACVIAVVLTGLGLVGMVSYAAQRRGREVAVRKVHGATGRSIYWLHSREMVWLAAAGTAIAGPVSYLAAEAWLACFAYRVSVGWQPIAASGAGMLVFALVTISLQTARASLAPPVHELRQE